MTRPVAGLLAVLLLAGCTDGRDRSSSAPGRSTSGRDPATTLTTAPSISAGSTATTPTKAAVPDEAARAELLELASRAAETILSYDHRTLDADLANATSLMTPEFAATITRIFDSLREQAMATEASVRAVVSRAGLVTATAEEAQVLVLVDQTSRMTGRRTQTTPSAPVVTLRRTGDTWLVSDLRNDQAVAPTEADPARRAVLDAATDMAEAFLNLSWTTIDADVAQVRELATDPFRDEYAASSGRLVELIRANRTVQQSRVLVAGLARAEDHTATVVLAAEGSSRNDGSTAKPVARRYRLELDLRLVDGFWLTSRLVLLP